MLSIREIKIRAKAKVKGRVIQAFFEFVVDVFKDLPRSIPVFFLVELYSFLWFLILDALLVLAAAVYLLQSNSVQELISMILANPVSWFFEPWFAMFLPGEATPMYWWRVGLLFVGVFILMNITIGQMYAKAVDIWSETGCGLFKAMRTSRKITRGHRGKVFRFELSFIGWHILGIFTLFLSHWYAIPVWGYAHEILYEELKQDAIEKGKWPF